MYVCLCHSVTDRHIEEAVAAGACSLRDLRQRLGVASQCGRCGKCAHSLLKEKRAQIQPIQPSMDSMISSMAAA